MYWFCNHDLLVLPPRTGRWRRAQVRDEGVDARPYEDQPLKARRNENGGSETSPGHPLAQSAMKEEDRARTFLIERAAFLEAHYRSDPETTF